MGTSAKSGNSFAIRFTKLLIRFFRLWASLVIVITAIFSYHVIIKPQRAAIFLKREEETERVLDEIRVQTIRLESYKTSLKGFELLQEQNVQGVLQALPPVDEKDMIVSVLSAIARDAGLFVTKVGIGVPASAQGYFPEAPTIELPVVFVPVHLELGGGISTYENLKELIYSMYNKFRIMNLKSLRIGGALGRDFVLDLDVFFIDNEKDT